LNVILHLISSPASAPGDAQSQSAVAESRAVATVVHNLMAFLP